jgi:hypothetical protein
MKRPFKIEDVRASALDETKAHKGEKYKDIVGDVEKWFKDNEEVIKIKHHVQIASLNYKFIIISNLGVAPKKTEEDMCSSREY